MEAAGPGRRRLRWERGVREEETEGREKEQSGVKNARRAGTPGSGGTVIPAVGNGAFPPPAAGTGCRSRRGLPRELPGSGTQRSPAGCETVAGRGVG